MEKTYEELGGRPLWGKKPAYRIAVMRRQGEKLHRDEGPADTKYFPDGSIWVSIWWGDGNIHRDDGPAYIRYSRGAVFPSNTRTFEELEKQGTVVACFWHLNGKEAQRFA